MKEAIGDKRLKALKLCTSFIFPFGIYDLSYDEKIIFIVTRYEVTYVKSLSGLRNW